MPLQAAGTTGRGTELGRGVEPITVEGSMFKFDQRVLLINNCGGFLGRFWWHPYIYTVVKGRGSGVWGLETDKLWVGFRL